MKKIKKNPDQFTFFEHIQELRKRIVISLGVIFLTFCILFAFQNNIMDFLTLPLLKTGYSLHALKVYESLMSIVKAAIFAALIIASPVWLTLIIGFITPALKRSEKKVFLLFFIFSTVLLILGLVFSYFVIIPISLNYLLAFGQAKVQNTLSIELYLDFFVALFFSTGLGFQLPLVLLLLDKTGLVNSKQLSKGRRYGIVIIFILAAIITPPDILSQIVIGIPLCLLYELGIILIRIFNKKKIPEPESAIKAAN